MDGGRRAGPTGAPDRLARRVVDMEQSAELDRALAVLSRLAAPLTGHPAVGDVLAGCPIGHATHPPLTGFRSVPG